MKSLITTILIVSCLQVFAQRDIGANNAAAYKKIYEYAYVEKKPFFAASKDSLRNYYLSHFIGFDSLVQRAISNGDTAKYIRVHFEFVVDEYGVPYDASFTYIGSTRYGSSSGDKKLKYFDDIKPYFKNAIKVMISKMPTWKPALQNNVRVECSVQDYFQFWLGINPESK